jgi:antirestriction protein
MVIHLEPEPEELISIWKALVRVVGKEYVDTDEIRADYVGKFGTMRDFAVKHVETLGDIPEIVKNNIDWDGVAGDLESDYNYDEESGHLFRA